MDITKWSPGGLFAPSIFVPPSPFCLKSPALRRRLNTISVGTRFLRTFVKKNTKKRLTASSAAVSSYLVYKRASDLQTKKVKLIVFADQLLTTS
jgi:hypothetical protein